MFWNVVVFSIACILFRLEQDDDEEAISKVSGQGNVLHGLGQEGLPLAKKTYIEILSVSYLKVSGVLFELFPHQP